MPKGSAPIPEKEVEAEIERQKLHFRPEGVDSLVRQTKFTRKEIQLLYRSFKENCPNGIVTLDKFQVNIASKIKFTIKGNSILRNVIAKI